MAFQVSVGSDVAKGVALPLQQPRDQFGGTVGREWGRRTQVIAYSDSSNTWRASVPNEGTAHPSADWLKFRRYEMRQMRGKPTWGELVLHYEQDEFSATYPSPGLPDDVVVEDGNVLEIDIRRHPFFDAIVVGNGSWPEGATMRDLYDWRNGQIWATDTVPAKGEDETGAEVDLEFAGDAVPEAIRGMSSYLVGTGQVTVVEYSYSTPTSVLEESGKRSVPPGYSGTVANWLLLSASRQQAGAYWTRRLVYQYSAKDISDVVYPDEANL